MVSERLIHDLLIHHRQVWLATFWLQSLATGRFSCWYEIWIYNLNTYFISFETFQLPRLFRKAILTTPTLQKSFKNSNYIQDDGYNLKSYNII